MNRDQRWEAELLDAFNIISLSLTPPSVPTKEVVVKGRLDNEVPLIGKAGFKMLMRNGSLLDLPADSLDEHFKHVDALSACLVPFDIVWLWFHREAVKRDKQLMKKKGKPFRFTIADILTAEERAVMSLQASYGNLIDDPSTEGAYFAKLKEKKKKKGNLFEDSSDEGEDDVGLSSGDEVEEEEDLDIDTHGDADIGKLMRMLTKKKEQKLESIRSGGGMS